MSKPNHGRGACLPFSFQHVVCAPPAPLSLFGWEWLGPASALWSGTNSAPSKYLPEGERVTVDEALMDLAYLVARNSICKGSVLNAKILCFFGI
eukprot:g43258.t1